LQCIILVGFMLRIPVEVFATTGDRGAISNMARPHSFGCLK
jgi:hypothetical protein